MVWGQTCDMRVLIMLVVASRMLLLDGYVVSVPHSCSVGQEDIDEVGSWRKPGALVVWRPCTVDAVAAASLASVGSGALHCILFDRCLAPLSQVISRDIHRTFPEHPLFAFEQVGMPAAQVNVGFVSLFACFRIALWQCVDAPLACCRRASKRCSMCSRHTRCTTSRYDRAADVSQAALCCASKNSERKACANPTHSECCRLAIARAWRS